MKTVSWIHGRSKVRRGVSELSGTSTGDKSKLRRSLGLDSFPSIQPFRAASLHPDENYVKGSMVFLGQGFGPSAAVTKEFNPADKEVSKHPVLTAVEKLQLRTWRRLSAP